VATAAESMHPAPLSLKHPRMCVEQDLKNLPKYEKEISDAEKK
jgi:hypothetical protein